MDKHSLMMFDLKLNINEIHIIPIHSNSFHMKLLLELMFKYVHATSLVSHHVITRPSQGGSPSSPSSPSSEFTDHPVTTFLGIDPQQLTPGTGGAARSY